MTPTLQRIDPANLHEARQAIARKDFQRADALFVQHLAAARDDADALAEYAVFCLRTGRANAAVYLLSRADALRPGQAGWLAQLGYALIERGDFVHARTCHAAALARSPGEASASFGIGLCHMWAADWTAAATAFGNALMAAGNGGDAFPILLRLADACHRSGDDTAAAAHYEAATRLAPNEPALRFAKARFLLDTCAPAQAMALIDACLTHTPNEPPILLEKARCLRLLGDLRQALQWLDRIERIAPGHAAPQAERGRCLIGAEHTAARHRCWLAAITRWLQDKDYDAAQALLDELLREDPTSAAAWNAQGRLESARHRDDAAATAWRKAIACDRQQLEAPANLAYALERSNRLPEAQAVAESAVTCVDAQQPQLGAVELRLVLAKLARRRGDADGALRELDRLDGLGPIAEQRRHAAYERGKLLDAQGNVAGAMAAFELGNRLTLEPWRNLNPGRNRTLAGIELVLDRLNGDWPRTWQPIIDLPPHRDVAFLLGFPRSGTTLLNQVLDSHPRINAIEEKPITQALMDLIHGMPGGYPQVLADIDGIDVGLLRRAYDDAVAIHGGHGDCARWVLDKFPMNSTLAGLLHRVFPQARFVFALRHPCDVVLSCFMQSFQLNNTMANFCTLPDTVALYVRTMELWQRWRELLPLNVHTIRYEDVVENFDATVRALCAFLGVEWQDDLRDFSDKALARGRIDTPSYEQVSQPIYRQARYRWLRYRKYLEPHLPALQPWIERFGYAHAAGGAP